MKKNAIKLTFLTLIAAGFLAAPVLMRAQDSSTNSTDTTTAPTTPKHAHRGLPFHGTVDSVDTNAMTLTVGSRTFEVTAKTKIMKDGEVATLADAVMGEKVTGYYRTNADGNLTAGSIHFGVGKKHKDTSDSTTSTNSASSN
jgi:hypothetical protein